MGFRVADGIDWKQRHGIDCAISFAFNSRLDNQRQLVTIVAAKNKFGRSRNDALDQVKLEPTKPFSKQYTSNNWGKVPTVASVSKAIYYFILSLVAIVRGIVSLMRIWVSVL